MMDSCNWYQWRGGRGLSGLLTSDNDSGAMVSVKYIDLQKREENVLDDREQCSASLAIEVHQTTF